MGIQEMTEQNRISLGMVGGGPGAGIGAAHRYGANMDGAFELTAGCFSRDPDKNTEMGRTLGLDPERIYTDWQRMAAVEGKRDDGVRAVSIVTPNDSHVPISLAFIDQGVHIICDKPLATSFGDAVQAHVAARSGGVIFGLTHIYACYAMVREARERVAAGELGELLMIQLEYATGGRAKLIEAQGDAGAQWRLTPEIAGPSSVLGDIGTHAHQLARFVTGLELAEVSADIHTVVRGRVADDNAHVNLRFQNGARGQLWASYAASGLGNGLQLRIFGDKGGLAWAQERPDELWIRPVDGSQKLLRRGEVGLSEAARRSSRMKIGHPQGILEAFANYYNSAAAAIAAVDAGAPVDGTSFEFATSRDGVLGMKFVEAAVESSAGNGRWVDATVDFASLESPLR
ncbi:MAG: Gfo/Idh/MocA family oxidoreductase [Hyphomicrobiales bacterium]|nr:Gfo/Idh/MocA family oxidoreductase [Hyphomicrobiales bacterium]